jgi:hypothetical protein
MASPFYLITMGLFPRSSLRLSVRFDPIPRSLLRGSSLALALLNDNLLSAPSLDKTSPLIGSVIDLLCQLPGSCSRQLADCLRLG